MRGSGRVFVVAGPSGVGKGTLIRRALEIIDTPEDYCYSVSSTTRPQGEGEVEGRDYHFVSDEQFDRLVEEGAFLEWERVHGNRYGTLKSEVGRALDKGCNVILELDVKGALTVKSRLGESQLIFIMPPTLKVLESRMRKRSRDVDGDMKLRIENAVEEIRTGRSRFDVLIVNDDLEKAARQLADVMRGD